MLIKMWRRSLRSSAWITGSCRVAASLESDGGLWVLSALYGRRRVDLFSGPLRQRREAERLCAWLNDQDVERWDYLIRNVAPHLLAGEWG